MNPLHKFELYKVDFCVIGGGLAGLFAAIQAARKGIQVALVHDRPVLGGNASSEIRMWPRGCHGKNNQETGLFEEMLCENMYRNPSRNYSIWDSVLHGMAIHEKNLKVFMNTSCLDVTMDTSSGKRIKAITAWQLTTYKSIRIEATMFADCSGDSILAPLVGAEYEVGRESHSEYKESIAPLQDDRKTMGLTCMMQAREMDHKVTFISPSWAKEFPDEEMFSYREHHMSDKLFNYWWIELGGNKDSIYDTESIREDLLSTAFGVWDHIKNRGDHGADNWELDWVGFLPGKRESRRYKGKYVLTENDILAEGKFDDIVAYGGWTMDDHDPNGFHADGAPNVFHPAPAPYGIPYRALYSTNILNLFFAGRNISATHAALSSTRVMATCSVMGQAVGMAAYLAVKYGGSPQDVYDSHLFELKTELMYADCYLPFNCRTLSEKTRSAVLMTTDENCKEIENIRNGFDRPIGGADNGAYLALNHTITYSFDKVTPISNIRLVFDSDLNRESVEGDEELRWIPMICNRHADFDGFGFPQTMTKKYEIECLDVNGRWRNLLRIQNNYQRMNTHPVNIQTKAIRFRPLETWGADKSHIFAIDIL